MPRIFPEDVVLKDLRKALESLKPCSDNGFGTLYYEYTKQQLLRDINKQIMYLYEKKS